MIDAPSAQTQGGVTDFLQRNPALTQNNQFFQIPHRDLEQYYPDQVDETYGNWRKTQAELDAVNAAGRKTFTGHKKNNLPSMLEKILAKTNLKMKCQ